MIKLWGRRTSINVQKVMWVLAELNLEYDRLDLGGSFGGLTDTSYVKINPHQKVPTLVDGEVVVWESNAILRYLGGAYGCDALFGATTATRAESDMWMEWYQSSVYASFQTLFHQTVKLPIGERSKAIREKAQANVSKQFALFDSNLATRAFINGEHLTLGDVPMAASLYRYFTMDIERTEYPNISRYYARLTQRSSYRDNVMIDYESLRAKN